MNGEHKITAENLTRKVIVYLRQSDPQQVKRNKESQALQYALADQARALGFRTVEVIDTDLGSSASIGARNREGFERLLATVALGEVALILSREMSRLSRTDKDWCRLLELCQIFGTLIGDAETIYDLSSLDDQLVLGIKGTLSVVELGVLRMRLQQGMENKARRGELYRILPPGYVLDGGGRPVKDPNLRVQESVELVFEKFRETRSIRQLFKWFLNERIMVPVNKSRDGRLQIVFQRPTYCFMRSVLRNPFYAGVYFHGRRPVEKVWVDGAVRKRQGRELEPEEIRIFIRDHHEGYISWQTFGDNRRIMRGNVTRTEPDASVGAVRKGRGLLVGLLRCGRCGRKIHVRYQGKSGTSARYLCSGTFAAAGSYCVGFGGAAVEKRFSEEILKVLSPLGLRASIKATEQIEGELGAQRQTREREIEQLDYEATRAFEQYDAIDPRNRLVASELERRWNEKLGEVEEARRALSDLERREQPVSAKDREKLFALGERFEDVWHNPACPMELKKKIVRILIEEILVDEDPPGTLSFIIHWRGGVHTSLEMPKPSATASVKTSMEDLDVIRQMAPRYGDGVIASVLCRMGRHTGRGNPWTQLSVRTARRNYGIPGRRTTLGDSEILTLQDAVKHTGTSDHTLKRLIEAQILPATQVVPFAPWEIRRSDLDSASVRQIVEHLQTTGKLVLDGGAPTKQRELFEQKQGGDHAR